MSLIDQAVEHEAPVDLPMTCVYRRSARGVVSKILPLHVGFVVPDGWFDNPGLCAWVEGEPILQATADDEPPAPKKARKVSE